MPAFPTDRNPTTELGGVASGLGQVAGAGYNAFAQYSPQYTAANVANMNGALRGNWNQGAFDLANPGVTEEFRRQQAGGGLQGWTIADFAAANAGLASGDASHNQYYTGSLGANLRTAYDQANPLQNAANAQLAADRDRLNGQTQPGVQTNTANFTGSAGRPDLVAQSSAGRPGVQTNTASFVGSQGQSGVRTNTTGFTPMAAAPTISAAQAAYNAAAAVGPVQTQIAAVNSAAGSSGINTAGTQHTAATAGPLVSAAQTTASQANGGPLLGALQNQALGAIRNQGSPLQATMQGQAQALLNANGGLTAGELANTQDAVRAAYAGRGMLRSNRGIGAEILNTDQAQRARLLQNIQVGQGVDAAGQQQLAANRTFGLAAQGQGQNLSVFNTNAANTNQLESARRTDAASLYNSGMLTQNSQFNATGLNAMNQSSAERADLNNRFNYTGEQATRQFNTAEQNRMAQAAAAQQAAEAQANAEREAQNNQFNIAQQNAMAMESARRADAAAQFNAVQTAEASRFNATGVNALNQSAAERADVNARFNYTGATQNDQFNASGINAMNTDAAARADANARLNLTTATQNDQFNAGLATDTARFNYTGANQNNQFNASGINAMNTDAAARADANARFNYTGAVQQGNDAFGRSQSVAGQLGTQAINPGTYAAQLASGTPDYTSQTLNYLGDLNNTNYNAAASRYNSAANNRAATTGAIINGVASLGSALICWVAREVYGAENPQWRRIRAWMLTDASDGLFAWYLATGERAARVVRANPNLRAQLRASMDARIATINPHLLALN